MRWWWFGVEQEHWGEVLMIALPLLTFLWRNYRERTSTAIAVSAMSLFLKWVATSLVALFDKIF